MTDSEQNLTPAQRTRVLTAVSEAMRRADAERPSGTPTDAMAVLAEVQKHLDTLAAIVRRSSADELEPYLAQIQEEICSRCPRQSPSGHCPFRSFGECAFYRNARLIIEAIARVLNEPVTGERPATATKPPLLRKEAPMIHRILIAVDHSGPAQYAAYSGIDLATKLEADVAILTVLPSPPAVIADLRAADAKLNEGWDHAKRLLAKCRSQLPEGIRVEEMISEGSPTDEILQVARNWHADLIVLGTHSRHGLSRFLLGSTAEAVVRRASCTVLVVRHPDEQPVEEVGELLRAEGYGT